MNDKSTSSNTNNSEEVAKFDRRTPGLFKDEWSGDAMVSLSSKNYVCYLPDNLYKTKVSAKGVQQGGGRNSDVLNSDGFEEVVRDRVTLSGTNRGFRICKETRGIITYSQKKTALNPLCHYVGSEAFFKGLVNCRSLAWCYKNFNSLEPIEASVFVKRLEKKTALSYYYDKRKVLSDGITTIPLDI
ncbi:Hypothetical protein PHPALM_5420 [Phytophthora palmivora]|uniref:Uncharacterized protein n=1 Tax=Phytophthora palmivora TaxID=4796 RepID=A0A2P4YHE9_9STRA|nr:Hypothetical protein PHPALM_5420 [Phytophthora palmivora]